MADTNVTFAQAKELPVRLQSYWKPSANQPHGYLEHDDHCEIDYSKVCTCGLISILAVQPYPTQLYGNYAEEAREQSGQLNSLHVGPFCAKDLDQTVRLCARVLMFAAFGSEPAGKFTGPQIKDYLRFVFTKEQIDQASTFISNQGKNPKS